MNTDLFLQAYKNLENTLRNKYSSTYLTFETCVATGAIKSKLQICRIMRNYIVHETDGNTFVTPSSTQVEFLRYMNNYLVNLK